MRITREVAEPFLIVLGWALLTLMVGYTIFGKSFLRNERRQ